MDPRRLRELLLAELVGSKPNEATRHDWVSLTYMALGFLALILGVIAFAKSESHRIAGVAGALGILAIAWEYVLIGVLIAVVLFLIAMLDP